MTCGDIHPNALDHFCAWVEEVIAPILKLEKNLDKFPQCIADDIKRQVHELSTSVFQIRGYIKGRTLLPFPQVNRNLNYVVLYMQYTDFLAISKSLISCKEMVPISIIFPRKSLHGILISTFSQMYKYFFFIRITGRLYVFLKYK